MKEDYKIERFTYIPSVFGENKRRFFPKVDLIIENKDHYYIKLSEELKHKL
jgi:hypothetical protein